MITIILLTGIALFVLLIGFFEIRIPFIYKDAGSNKKKGSFLQSKPDKFGKTGNNIRNFLKTAKNGVNYRIIQNRKTSDVA